MTSDPRQSDYGTPPPYGTAPTPDPAGGRQPSSGVPACTACRSESLEQGFVEDNGEGSQGFARWIPGALQRGLFGGARRMGMPRFEIVAMRCTQCHHLDLYVGGRV